MNILDRSKWFIIAFIVIMVFPNKGYTVELQPTFTTTLEQELSSIAREGTDTQTKVLIDGTTIMPGPGSSYSIKSFPDKLSDNSNIGMVIIVNRGLVRIIGGYLNNKAPITILTPSAKLILEKADVMVSVDENGVTRASMVYGKSLIMESGGSQEIIVKPGYELVSQSPSSPPQTAIKQEKEIILASVTAAESSLGSNDQEEATDDDVALSSDGENYSGATDDDKVSSPLPDTSLILPSLTGSGSGSAAGALEIGFAADEKSATNSNQIGQTNGDTQGTHQELECCTDNPDKRSRGLSTNRFYTSKDSFTQQISKKNTNTSPIELSDSMNKTLAHYQFFNNSNTENIQSFAVKLDNDPEPLNLGSDFSIRDTAVILDGLEDTKISTDDKVIALESVKTLTNFDGQNGAGNRFSKLANYSILTTGFTTTLVNNNSSGQGGQNNPLNKVQVVSRNPENFVILEVQSLDIPDKNERFFFAAGDVVYKKQFLGNISVDHLFLSAGLNNYDQKTTGVTRASDIRAFARDDSVINNNLDSLSDSGLLVVNHATGSNQPTRVLHTDFSLVGTDSKQTSTISTTLGNVIYKNTRFDDDLALGAPGASSPDDANDVVFNAIVLGSTQGKSTLVSFNSEVFNTSAGGGLDTLGSGPGYADYFVLENFDPNNPSTAGTEHAIGADTSVDRQYAFLRLASIQSSKPESELTRTQNATNGGYTAGLISTETGNNLLSIDYLLSGSDPKTNLSIKNDLASSGLTVDMNFNNGQSLSLGGSDNNAAFVDDDRFAATNGSATLVSAGLVKSGVDSEIATKIDIPEYMQWGFFFGDVDISATGTSHAHLASWVAGSVPSAADLPVSGSATYTGSAIGNVFDGTNSYVAAGTYTNTWDFAARRGTAQIQEFDGVNYNGITARENTSSQFVGALANDAGTREVGLQGSFVQNAGDAAAGVMGQFYIQNTDSDVYRAAGTFAADKQ